MSLLLSEMLARVHGVCRNGWRVEDFFGMNRANAMDERINYRRVRAWAMTKIPVNASYSRWLKVRISVRGWGCDGRIFSSCLAVG